MTGFHTLAGVRPRMTAPGRPPMPVVPIERCRPLPPAPKPARGPAIPIPEHISAPIERQVVRPPLGLLPVEPHAKGFSGARMPPLAPIIALVAERTGIPVEHMKGRSRKANVVKARQLACFVARRFTGRSTNQIGKAFGRDHSTVLHALRRAESVYAGNPRPAEDTAEAWIAYLWGRQWPKK